MYCYIKEIKNISSNPSKFNSSISEGDFYDHGVK